MKKAAVLLLLAGLVGCGDGDIHCTKWSVSEEAITIYPYIVSPVKRCQAWVVREE